MELPRIDHVSLVAAPGALGELGFRLTPTHGATSHSRIFLDRHYLEVEESGEAEIGAVGWFLRGDDLDQAAVMLSAEVMPAFWPTRYQGHDGVWVDVSVVGQTPALPTLTKRTDVAAASWPPPLEAEHPNGVTAIAELQLQSEKPALVEAYLTAMEALPLGAQRFRLANGVTVLVEKRAGPEGITGITFRRAHGQTFTLAVSAAAGRDFR